MIWTLYLWCWCFFLFFFLNLQSTEVQEVREAEGSQRGPAGRKGRPNVRRRSRGRLPVLREGAERQRRQRPGAPRAHGGGALPAALHLQRAGADRARRGVLGLRQHAAWHDRPPAVQPQPPGRKADGTHGEVGQSTSRLVTNGVLGRGLNAALNTRLIRSDKDSRGDLISGSPAFLRFISVIIKKKAVTS